MILRRQIAVRDRRGHLRDVADLAVRLPAMEFTRFGQILPGAGDAVHIRLAAELAFGADFARHARHFRWRTS